MRAQYEKIPQDGNAALHVLLRKDPSFPFNWHYHPEYELTTIVDSVGQRLVGNGIEDYGPGDLVLLGPNLPHSWRSRSGVPGTHVAIVVQFRRDFLGDTFFDLEEAAPIAQLLERSTIGLAFGHTSAGKRAIPILQKLPNISPLPRLIALLSVLQELAFEKDFRALSTGSLRPAYRREYQHRIDAVCAYLDKHFIEKIDYPAVARLIYSDQASLCRFFKRATGRTITTYVNELRVAAATQLLIDSDMSVLDVGCRVGFGNHANFNRQFKRLKGISPGAVRKEFRRFSETAL